MIMEEYVVRNSEAEGHFDFFDRRTIIWGRLTKSNGLKQILDDLTRKYEQLNLRKKSDKQMYIHMSWTRYVTSLAKSLNQDSEDVDDDFHLIYQFVHKNFRIAQTS